FGGIDFIADVVHLATIILCPLGFCVAGLLADLLDRRGVIALQCIDFLFQLFAQITGIDPIAQMIFTTFWCLVFQTDAAAMTLAVTEFAVVLFLVVDQVLGFAVRLKLLELPFDGDTVLIADFAGNQITVAEDAFGMLLVIRRHGLALTITLFADVEPLGRLQLAVFLCCRDGFGAWRIEDHGAIPPALEAILLALVGLVVNVAVQLALDELAFVGAFRRALCADHVVEAGKGATVNIAIGQRECAGARRLVCTERSFVTASILEQHHTLALHQAGVDIHLIGILIGHDEFAAAVGHAIAGLGFVSSAVGILQRPIAVLLGLAKGDTLVNAVVVGLECASAGQKQARHG